MASFPGFIASFPGFIASFQATRNCPGRGRPLT